MKKTSKSNFINYLNKEINIENNTKIKEKVKEKINKLEVNIRYINELVGFDNPYEYEEMIVNRF